MFKVKKKTPEQYKWIDFAPCYGISSVDFEQVNAGWVHTHLGQD